MRKILFILLSFLSNGLLAQQEKNNHTTFQVEYIYANTIKHKNKISHLAISNPEGFMLSWNNKTTSTNKNLAVYNYPEYGYTFKYLDFKNPILGKAYVLLFNYNFYFGNRSNKNQFYLKLAPGIAYNTNPFDFETNNKNIAFGSHLLSNINVGFSYKRKQIFDDFDFNFGVSISHYSNGSIKAPNLGLNLLTINTGVNYNFDGTNPFDYSSVTVEKKKSFNKEPINLNLHFSGGMNSSGNLGGKQFPFYVGSIYADKRLGRKSIVQFGGEIFFSKFLKELIRFNSVAFPEYPEEDGMADYKRVSVFLGHELDIDNISIITQLGYYVYYPYSYETRYYERIGVKKPIGKKWFATASIKAHLFIAESFDLGIGIKL